MARLAIERPASPEAAVAEEARTESPHRGTGWLERAAPWLVFGLAAAFRLVSLDLAAFTYDEADVMLRARAVSRGYFALTGPMTSWGIPDPPFQIYLLAPVALLPWPVLATLGFMALLNALVVLGSYRFGARFFGWRVGLMAGLLFAVNPWAIYFGRRGWDQLQPALTLVALWAAFEMVVARRAVAGLPFFLALAANVQARLLAAAYAPAALVSLALAGRVWLSRWSVLGVLGGILLSVPYAVWVIVNREQIAAILAEGNRGVGDAPRPGVLEFSWWLSAGLNLLPMPGGLARWVDQLGAIMRVQSWLVAGLLLASLGICLFQIARRAPGWRRYALLLAWTILPLGLVALQSSAVYLHYLVLLFPLPFLLLALALDALAGLRTPLRWLAPLLCLAVALPQGATWIVLERTLTLYDTNEAVEASLTERRLLAELAREGQERLGTGERYGAEIPVRYWLAAADRARAELAGRPRELLVVTEGTNPLADEKPAILEAMLGPDLRPTYLLANPLLLPIDRPALLMVTSDTDPAVLLERLGPRLALIPLPTLARNARDGIRLVDVPARSVDGWVSAIGARPVGNIFARVVGRAFLGEPVQVLTLWVDPLEGVRPRAALISPTGQRIDEEEEEVNLRPRLDVPAGRLLAVRHRFEARVAGEHRLLVEDGTPTGQMAEVWTVTVQPR